MKQCIKCGQTKCEQEFYSTKGGKYIDSWCKECKKEHNRIYKKEWRKRPDVRQAKTEYYRLNEYGFQKAQEYKRKSEKKHYFKQLARQCARAAFKLGIIKERPCEKCGTDKWPKEMHHEDYTKPLDVIWFCRECHKQRHGKK